MKIPDYSAFTKAVASADGQPAAACAALEQLAHDVVGVKLFTIMMADTEARVSRRLYTNMPDAYPASGTKPYNDTYWSEITLERRETFVANSIAEIADVFPDHALINTLGCQSVINVPVEIGGRVVGTINCLHEAGFYTEDRVKAAEALKLPGSVCILLCQTQIGDRT